MIRATKSPTNGEHDGVCVIANEAFPLGSSHALFSVFVKPCSEAMITCRNQTTESLSMKSKPMANDGKQCLLNMTTTCYPVHFHILPSGVFEGKHGRVVHNPRNAIVTIGRYPPIQARNRRHSNYQSTKCWQMTHNI
jgi:hypothetical protein